ncbi:MAG: hypothetical protein ABR564_04325, partial [Candidatus Dormibacteria bacterium]
LPVTPPGLYVIPGGKTTVTTLWRNIPKTDVTAVATVHASINGRPAGDFTSNTLTLSLASTGIPWVPIVIALALLLPAAIVFLLLRRLRRPAACTHCSRQFPRRILIDVTEMGDVAECNRCLRSIHDTEHARLCTGCLKDHLVKSADKTGASTTAG